MYYRALMSLETPDTLQKPAEFTHDTNLKRHTATLHRCPIPAS